MQVCVCVYVECVHFCMSAYSRSPRSTCAEPLQSLLLTQGQHLPPRTNYARLPDAVCIHTKLARKREREMKNEPTNAWYYAGKILIHILP